jgi:hypothetical protein
MPAPLAGVRVLDLTRFLAGPYCTMLLADYGADVVNSSRPRAASFRPAGAPRDSYFFLSSNRGKRSRRSTCAAPRRASCSCGSCRASTCWWRTTAPT